MPQSKFQGIVFGAIMSVSMAYGMEVYNLAIKHGYPAMPGGFTNMPNTIFLEALLETSYMCLLVFAISNLWGNRLGQHIARKIIRPESDNPFFIVLIVSSCTVLVMCPSMSLAAAVLFNMILGSQPLSHLPALWVGTILKNFPMALLWNLFFAGPFTRHTFRFLFRKKLH